MTEAIEIDVLKDPETRVAVVSLMGQLDSITSNQVERQLDLLIRDKYFKIVVNLSRVTYLSSSGWGLFIAILKEIKTNKGDLKLVGLTEDVLQVYQLLEIDFYLSVHKTNENAIKSFD